MSERDPEIILTSMLATVKTYEARVRTLEAALAKLGRAHAEVCPSKDECAVLIEARALLP